MKNLMLKVLALSVMLAFAARVEAQEQMTLALARNTLTAAEETFTYAIPKQLGFFAAENLTPSILHTDGSTAALQAVASGFADVAYASSLNIAAAIDKGVPLKAFGGLTVKWPYFIDVPPNSDIKTIADLKGKRVGVISLASASYADLRTNLKLAGLTEEDVTMIPIGAGARAAAALASGEVDAVDSYSDSFTVMRQNGVDLTLLARPEPMEKLFSVTMVTSEKILREKPQQLASFARAAYKGIIYTKLYPENALQLAFAEFPELMGSDDLQGEGAKNTAEAMAIALGDSIPASGEPESWGMWLNIPLERWDSVLGFAHETGLSERKLSVEEVWDGSLMQEAYNFDINSLIKKVEQER